MGIGVPIDADHHKINVRLVFDVKASGKRKGRLVAQGDLTEICPSQRVGHFKAPC